MLHQPMREERPESAKPRGYHRTGVTKPTSVGRYIPTVISLKPEGDLIHVSVHPEKNKMFNLLTLQEGCQYF